jgi:hypothetical protein
MAGDIVVVPPDLSFMSRLIVRIIFHFLFQLHNLLDFSEYIDQMPHNALTGKTKMNRRNFTLIDLCLFHFINDLNLILQNTFKMSCNHSFEQLWVVLILLTINRNVGDINREIIDPKRTILDIVDRQFFKVSQSEDGQCKDEDNR